MVRAESTEGVLSARLVARMLHVRYDVAKQLLESGAIPARRISGGWRVSRNAVLAWLEHREPEGDVDAP